MKKFVVFFDTDVVIDGQQVKFNHEFEASNKAIAETQILNDLDRKYFRLQHGFLKTERVVNFSIYDMKELEE